MEMECPVCSKKKPAAHMAYMCFDCVDSAVYALTQIQSIRAENKRITSPSNIKELCDRAIFDQLAELKTVLSEKDNEIARLKEELKRRTEGIEGEKGSEERKRNERF